MIENSNLQVFSSDQAPSIPVKNAVKKACSRDHHVVSCVENLTADVKPCTGKYHEWKAKHNCKAVLNILTFI